MTWARARSTIAGVLSGVQPSTRGNGLGERFVEDKRAGGDQPVSSPRRFWLEVPRILGRQGPAQMVSTQAVLEVRVVVEYKTLTDRAALDAAIVADWADLTAALSLPGAWQPASETGVRCIWSTGEQWMPASITDVVVDATLAGRRLEFTFLCEVLL
jgi:hypothetical protein